MRVSVCAGKLKSIWTDVGDTRIHARVSPDPGVVDASAIVLVHGFIISSRYMMPVAECLAADHPVYASDLPGFGLSDKPRSPLRLNELTDTLAAWMHVAGLERAVLLGNSFGCQVIAALAVRYPNRVERTILVGPTIDRHHRTTPQQIVRLQLDMLREPPSLPLPHVPDYIRAGPRRILCTYREMMTDRIEERLPHIRVPTLVVHGARDLVTPEDWLEEVARLLPLGHLVTIPGAAQAVNYNAPLELARVVHGFLGTS